MKILVTGSAGHLGEALVRTLRSLSHEVTGLDILPSAFTDVVGSITDAVLVRQCLRGADAVLHAATLHKPHVETHSRQAFVDTNISGTLTLLEAAVEQGIRTFVYTSTTSVFGDALVPPPGAPAAWITEDVRPKPKNIYGVTKAAAEDLCELAHRNQGLNCLVLRTSRFFPEADDDESRRSAFSDENLKANEYLYRRVALEDAVSAHLCALERAADIGFARYIISATTPFERGDMAALRSEALRVVLDRVPGFEAEYRKRGWQMFSSLDRVYVNERARRELGWQPVFNFAHVVERLRGGAAVRSPLSSAVGYKGYHPG